MSRNPVRLAGAALALVLAVARSGLRRLRRRTAAPTDRSAPTDTPATPLTVGLGYIPNVQFAQFYLADQAGYYADAGLDVTLQNKIDPDLITLLGQGAVDIGSGDGTSVIPAVSQGIPVVYTSTIYGTFPAVVIAKAGSGIATAADLRGKRIGIPGRYGTNWIMLQALLKEAGLTVDDVTIVEFPDFSQAAALQQGQVDAATGFANNEPIQLRNAGIEPVVLTVDDAVPLPGPGLVTGTKTLETQGGGAQGLHRRHPAGDGRRSPRTRRRASTRPSRPCRTSPRTRRSSARSWTRPSPPGRTRAPGRRSGRSTGTAGSSRWTS